MGRRAKAGNRRAVLGVTGFLLFSPWGFAAPPQAHHFAAPPQSLPQHLDLRPPSHLDATVNTAQKNHSFAAPLSRQTPGPPERTALAPMASDGMRQRPAIQDFVRRVHHEGLPVARLFESKSALLHLGLSPKGKPGLWLVQKTH